MNASLWRSDWFLSASSDVLYPKSTCSPHSGVPAEVLCRGRDFVVSCSFICSDLTAAGL